MYDTSLSNDFSRCLAVLGKSSVLKNAYLAGGSAVGLHLGHRSSDDFDFCTTTPFAPASVAEALAQFGHFEVSKSKNGQLVGVFCGISFGLYECRHPLLFEPVLYSGVKVADVRDVAAMKMNAIIDRGAKRDFIDVFYICSIPNMTLNNILELYYRKFGPTAVPRAEAIHSLVRFENGEHDEMPAMLRHVEWEEVKSFFIEQVRGVRIQ